MTHLNWPDVDLKSVDQDVRRKQHIRFKYYNPRQDHDNEFHEFENAQPEWTGLRTSYEWVNSHQDIVKKPDKLTEAEKLNIRMDEKATQAHALGGQWASTEYQAILPSEKFVIAIRGRKVVAHLRQELLRHFEEAPLLEYLRTKYRKPNAALHTVGATFLKYMLANKTLAQRATTAKFIHGWIPTSAFLQAQQRNAPGCPFCNTPEEIWPHVFPCSHDDAALSREAVWTGTTKALKDMGTHPLLIRLWDDRMRFMMHLPNPTTPPVHQCQCVKKSMAPSENPPVLHQRFPAIREIPLYLCLTGMVGGDFERFLTFPRLSVNPQHSIGGPRSSSLATYGITQQGDVCRTSTRRKV